MTGKPEKILLVYLDSRNLRILVPKKRGEGFQKVPLGHHLSPLARFVMNKGWDMTGLDGHLELDLDQYVDASVRAGVFNRVVTPVAEFLGFPWREIDRVEFWTLHPVSPANLALADISSGDKRDSAASSGNAPESEDK